MLRYSSAAKEALTKFYAFYNEANIYVEDEDDEVFYEELLKKVVGDLIRITRVFGVGGKGNLVKKMQEFTGSSAQTNEFFIADGDFDRILNRLLPTTDRLHVLDEYCIENFLFEEDAVCSIVQEEKPLRTFEQWKAKLSFSKWLEETIDGLSPLFACFIFIQKNGLDIQNVKIGIGKFISDGTSPRLDKKKIDEYIASVSSQKPVNGRMEFEKEMLKIIQMMGDNWQTRKRNICGKEYLMPLLFLKL